MEFTYPTDLDLFYEMESELAKHVSSSITMEDNSMVNTLKYDLVANDTTNTLDVTANSSNETISQYQEVLLQAKIGDSLYQNSNYSGFVVMLHISTPTTDSPSNVNDFEYHIHLMPNLNEEGTFKVHLNEFLGKRLKIGTLNTCKFKFQVLAKVGNNWDSYVQSSTQTIELYKTNTDYSEHGDDLTNAFVVLNELQKKLA